MPQLHGRARLACAARGPFRVRWRWAQRTHACTRPPTHTYTRRTHTHTRAHIAHALSPRYLLLDRQVLLSAARCNGGVGGGGAAPASHQRREPLQHLHARASRHGRQVCAGKTQNNGRGVPRTPASNPGRTPGPAPCGADLESEPADGDTTPTPRLAQRHSTDPTRVPVAQCVGLARVLGAGHL